jgi:multiple sugar transport system substrate-binding protein
MRVPAILLATTLMLVPAGARAADLVVWWVEGFNSAEDQAVREIVAAFEHKTGKEVELVLQPDQDLPTRAVAAAKAGAPPDLLSGLVETSYYYPQWAHEGWLADLSDVVGPFAAQFDREALDRATLLDATAGRRSLYVLPTGRTTNHVHVWKNLLEKAGLTLADVPREWEPFWSFFCDTIQPAVRRATGREDVCVVPSAPASGGSGRLRATWQGSKGEAVAFEMPVSGQLGEFANGIRPFSR